MPRTRAVNGVRKRSNVLMRWLASAPTKRSSSASGSRSRSSDGMNPPLAPRHSAVCLNASCHHARQRSRVRSGMARLPNASAAEFERHLSVCPSCVAYLATYRETIALAQHSLDDADASAPEDLVAAILALRHQP